VLQREARQQNGAVTRFGKKRGESSPGWLSLSAGSQVSQPQKKRSPVQDPTALRVAFCLLRCVPCIFLFSGELPIY